MLRTKPGFADIQRPYVDERASVEIHRLRDASLRLPYRRWHVVTIMLGPAAVVRRGASAERRGRFECGDIGLYPAGPGETIEWPEAINAVHVHLNPRRLGTPCPEITLPYRFRLRDRIIAEIGRELNERNLSSADSLLSALSHRLIECYAEEAAYSSGPRIGKAAIDDVLRLIDDNHDKQLRVSELAAYSDVSRFHFSRAFQRIMGLAPAEYLVRKRVEAARHLLGRSSFDLARVALDCGFADQSHMTRAFQRYTGTTPRRFRIFAQQRRSRIS